MGLLASADRLRFGLEWAGPVYPHRAVGAVARQEEATGGTVSMGMAARVLVVDDDTALRTMLVTIVEAMGWHARGATDGADALEILGCWRPDVILLDLLMPEMNGARFLRRGGACPIS